MNDNLSTVSLWPGINPIAPSAMVAHSFPEDTKNFLGHPRFLINSIPQPEMFTTYDKQTDIYGKHFLTAQQQQQEQNSSSTEPLELKISDNTQQASVKNELVNNNSTQTTKTNNSNKIRPYSCDICGKTFLLKHHLTTHARTHTGIRPHVCPHCGKAFTHKHCLNTHLLLHSTERPYQCVECKKSFTLKHHLITHTRVNI